MRRREAALSYREQVARATVAVYADGSKVGTGFFVQPGLVVTCAHVVRRQRTDVRVEHGGRSYPVDLILRVPDVSDDNNRLYPPPDLGFLRLVDPGDNPFVIFPEAPKPPDRLEAATHGGADPTPYPLSLTVAGQRGPFLRVTGDQIMDGMSGAPAYDPRTGFVHGMVKASDDRRSVAGGLLVSATSIALTIQEHRAVLQPTGTIRRSLEMPSGTPIHHLVRAQYQASERLNYRVVDDPSVTRSRVYVKQRLGRAGGRRTVEHSEPVEAETALSTHRHLLLTGAAGAGKTSLIGDIAHRSAAWWLGEDDDREPPFGWVVAVRAPARLLASGDALLEKLAEAVSKELGSLLDEPVTAALFADPPVPGADWLLMVDGLDEIVDTRQRSFFLDAIGQRLGEFNDRFRFLVTSRPLGDEEFGRLRQRIPKGYRERLGEYELALFDAAALRDFVKRWFRARAVTDGETRAGAFMETVGDSRLRPVLATPLLATIAAFVYEQHPGPDFPLDRTGLYEAFVDQLVYEKRTEAKIWPALRAEFADDGPEAEAVARFLIDEIEPCLEHLGHSAVFHQTDLTAESVLTWLRRRLPRMPRIADIRARLDGLLVTTGVIVRLGPVFQFRHRSLAEYFAAGSLSREDGAVEVWSATVRQTGFDSLSAFTLARVIRNGSEIRPVLRRLTRPGWFHRYPDLRLLGAILHDGMHLGRYEKALHTYVIACVRHSLILGDADARALAGLMTRLVARTGVTPELIALARDRSISIIKCVEAARVILERGTPDQRPVALRALVDAADRVAEPIEDRLWALKAVAELDEDRTAFEKIFAIACPPSISGASVPPEDEVPSAPRYQALAILTDVDPEGAALGLLARATDARAPITARTEALDLAALVLDDMSWGFVGAPAATQRYVLRYRSMAALRGRHGRTSLDDPNGLPGFILSDSDAGLPERLAAALILIWPMAPPTVRRMAVNVMRDPGFSWMVRLHIANDIGPWNLADESAHLMQVLAADGLIDAVSRVAVASVLCGTAPGPARDILSRLVEDPTESITARSFGLHVLRRDFPELAERFSGRWAADRAAPTVLRLQILEPEAMIADSPRSRRERILLRIARGLRRSADAVSRAAANVDRRYDHRHRFDVYHSVGRQPPAGKTDREFTDADR
jgi:hypothetical protein